MHAAKQTARERTRLASSAGTPPAAAVVPTPRALTAATRRRTRPLANPPAVAPCADLDALLGFSPEAAREHVTRYLRDVMSPDEADAFEADSYRWELHLVAIDNLCLVRGVELDREKLSRYRRALARGRSFPAVVGLGGDGEDITHGVLLCDGYHRVVAMRDAGIHYVWAWLAAGVWATAPAGVPALSW